MHFSETPKNRPKTGIYPGPQNSPKSGFREIRFLGAERLPERVQQAGTAHNVRRRDVVWSEDEASSKPNNSGGA